MKLKCSLTPSSLVDVKQFIGKIQNVRKMFFNRLDEIVHQRTLVVVCLCIDKLAFVQHTTLRCWEKQQIRNITLHDAMWSVVLIFGPALVVISSLKLYYIFDDDGVPDSDSSSNYH